LCALLVLNQIPSIRQDYAKLNHRITDWVGEQSFLVQTAATSRDGPVSLHLDNDARHNSVGSTIEVQATRPWRRVHRYGKVTTVRGINVANFIRHHILARKVPAARNFSRNPSIVMKLDVEGAEYKFLPGAALQGIICELDYVFMEWHPSHFSASVTALRAVKEIERSFHVLLKASKAEDMCNVTLTNLDDETYSKDGAPLPE